MNFLRQARFITVALAFICVTGKTRLAAAVPLDPDISKITNYKALDDRQDLCAVQDRVRDAAGHPAELRHLQRQFVGLLGSTEASAEAKAFACRQLALIGDAQGVPALAALLTDPSLSHMARFALERIPGPAAGKALRQALGRLQGLPKAGVINSLGERRDSAAARLLAKTLDDSEPLVAEASAGALAKIGGPLALKALTQARAQAGPARRPMLTDACLLLARRLVVQEEAEQAYGLYQEIYQDASELPGKRLAALTGLIAARPSACASLVVPILEGEDAALKTFALRFVRETSDPASAKAFAAQLPKLPPEDQVRVIGALAAQKSPAVRAVSRTAVLAATKASDQNVQVAALKALRWLGNPLDIPVLLDTLAQSSGDLAQAAKATLVGLSSEQVDQQLCARLPQVTGNARRTFVELAGLRRVTAAWPELVKAANDADPYIRMAGIKALGETASAADFGALTGLLAKPKSDDEVAAVKDALESAWARIPDKGACADRLLACLPTSEVATQCALLRVLGMVGTQKALDAVQTALASSEPKVHDTAVRVLADWAEAPALPALLEVFRTTQDETHRFFALRGCVRLLGLAGQPVEEKMKIYGELMTRTKRNDDRKVILSGLASVHEAGALKLIESLLNDSQVQAEAEVAMLDIVDGIKGSAPAEALAVATKLQAESKSQATRDRAAKILGEMAKRR